MPLSFTERKQIVLKRHPEFSEAWLHDRICDNTSMLGLGELDIVERERTQYSGGRLDMLLGDGENTRYEVEIMLGPTDPSHIIRAIEYWDVERRRYPAYDHVAVLIAEEVTSRFLNVMSLLAGSIPLIAIQLNALQVGDQIILDFVKVLDQRTLRIDDAADTGGEEVDRASWESRVGATSLSFCDRVLALANEHSEDQLEFNYKKNHIAATVGGAFLNVFVIYPRRTFARIQVRIENTAGWNERMEEAGFQVSIVGAGTRLRFNLTNDDFDKNQELVSEILRAAVEQYRS